MKKNNFTDKELRAIHFFSEGIEFKFKRKKLYRNWLCMLAKSKNYKIKALNYVFCKDEYLLQLNQDFLQHDTLTDIVTFGVSAKNEAIVGDIYISIDRILENSEINKVKFATELRRVMAHGLLHLCGFGDKSTEEKVEMTKQEDIALALITFI